LEKWPNCKRIYQELRFDKEPNALSEHTVYRWIEAFERHEMRALKMALTHSQKFAKVVKN